MARQDRRLRRPFLTRLRRLLLALVVALLWGLPAAAHPLPGTAVLLDFDRDAVHARLELPLAALALAFRPADGVALSSADALAQPGALDRLQPALAGYLAAHVRPRAPDGRAWLVQTGSLQLQHTANGAELVVRMRWQPPAGAPLRRLHLTFDAISHELVAHQTLVAARNDWQGGVFAAAPEPLATLHWGRSTLDIDRPHAPWWRAFAGLVALGAQHIAEGTDHLLFLLVLLLPAPLRAARGRWTAPAGLGAALRRVLVVVTAFTLGHSATLAAGALALLRLPAAPVECLIALSILVSAVHALRPLFPGREGWIAAGFGLVHGLAFSETVAGLGLDGDALALAVLGFNLGIEAMQLLVVACALPWLLWLAQGARPAWYRLLRQALGVGAGVAALAWLAERGLGWSNPLGEALDAGLAAVPWRLLAPAAALAWGALVLGRRRGMAAPAVRA